MHCSCMLLADDDVDWTLVRLTSSPRRRVLPQRAQCQQTDVRCRCHRSLRPQGLYKENKEVCKDGSTRPFTATSSATHSAVHFSELRKPHW